MPDRSVPAIFGISIENCILSWERVHCLSHAIKMSINFWKESNLVWGNPLAVFTI